MSLNELIKLTQIVNKNTKRLLFTRSCENIGQLSGSLNGFLNTKLSDYGKKQAKFLSLEFFIEFKPENYVFTSDLLRCKETANICFAYDNTIKYSEDKNLRDINYGKMEGLYYDGLDKIEKAKINDKNNQFESGESWTDAKLRTVKFLNSNKFDNNNLNFVFSHNAIINNILRSLNNKNLLKSGSMMLVTLKSDQTDNKNSKTIEDYYKFKSEYNNTKASTDNIDIYKEKNEIFDKIFTERIADSIKNIDYVYQISDLTENIY